MTAIAVLLVECRMLRFLAAVVTLAAIFAAIFAAWVPIDLAETALRARLGPHEYAGWSATGLHLLYTVVVTGVILVSVLWPLSRLLARMKQSTLHRLTLLGQCLALMLMLWMLLLPAFIWRALGVINVLYDAAPAQVEPYRFITVVEHHRGRVHVDYARADDPSKELSLFTVRPPADTEPGAIITLLRHRGALGMTYISAP